MKTYRRCVLIVLTVLTSAIIMGTAPAAQDNPGAAVRFAIIGDRTNTTIPGVYEQALAEAERLRPELIMTVGDHIEGYTEDTTRLNREWAEYQQVVKDVTVPFYKTPGNHDVLNQVQLDYYQSRIERPNYSFDYRGIHFVVFNNAMWERSEQLPATALSWLADDLQANRTAAMTLVFMHKPFWYNTTSLNKPDTLHALFKAFGVDGVFTGHFHEYFSGTFDGIKYTGVGSSGGGADVGLSGLQYHFCWVTVDGKELTVTPIALGAVRPWDEVTVDQAHLVARLRELGLVCAKAPVTADLSVREQPVAVTVHNLTAQPIQDTIVWTGDDNWTITPEWQAVTLLPGATASLPFMVSCRGDLYPLPTATLGFPYAPGKETPVSLTLGICRQVNCRQAERPPIIDGVLDEAVWTNPATRFFNSDGQPARTDSTAFYFAYDQDNLYLAACCYDRALDSLRAAITMHDGTVSGEDCIGFFLQPDTAQAVAYQILVNSIGTIFDQKLTPGEDGYFGGDRSWDGTYTIKTGRGNDFWTVEAVVPLDQFGVVGTSGTTWGLNFRRKQPRYGTTANWQSPVDYNPASFGRLMMQ